MKVLVTGASGFVGRELVNHLAREPGMDVRGAMRAVPGSLPGVETVTADLDSFDGWPSALAGVDVVVHLAARVHVMHDTARDPLAEYRRINVAGTLALARAAAAVGVRRFVFMSSVKVNGDEGVFTEVDPPSPEDPYAVSKHEAEVGLRQIELETGLPFVIVRPPLVYGPGVRANFASLMRAIARGAPLPIGAIDNRRSLVAVGNLVDFVALCLTHPAALGETFLVSDGEDLSTPELARRLAGAMGRSARVVSVPPWLLMGAAALVGKRPAARRLLSSLQVDITKARQRLGWAPPLSVDEGLRRTVAAL